MNSSKLPDKWDALRRAAEDASPDPWEVERNLDLGNLYIREARGQRGRIARIWNDRTRTEENAAFIAAANPSAILELLSELRGMAAKIASLELSLERGSDLIDETLAILKIKGGDLTTLCATAEDMYEQLRELREMERGGEGQWISVGQGLPTEGAVYLVAWLYSNMEDGTRIGLCEWGGFGSGDCWEDESIADLITHWQRITVPSATLSVTEGVDGMEK